MEGSGSSEQNNGDEEQKVNLYLKVMKTVGFTVKRSETVRNLKALLKDKEGISECIQEFFFSGEKLWNDQKLVDCGIQQNSTLLVLVQNFLPLRLFVKPPSDHKIVVVEARCCDTIQNVKSYIMAKEGIYSCNFNLIHAGKVLEDDKTLASLNIQGESMLHMMITPRDMLTISVKLPTGEILKLEVKIMYTVSDVKTMVESIVGFPVNDLSLACDGVQLEDSMYLFHYNIAEGSILELNPQRIQVFVKDFSGKTLTVDVSLGDLVINLKEKIFKKLGAPASVQRLVFGGKYLENGRNLSTYNIQKDSTLHLWFWPV